MERAAPRMNTARHGRLRVPYYAGVKESNSALGLCQIICLDYPICAWIISKRFTKFNLTFTRSR